MIGIANNRISDIAIDVKTDDDGVARRVTLSWRDEVGTPHTELYCLRSAEQFATDLHAATLMGEEARHVYLIGRIREIERLSG